MIPASIDLPYHCRLRPAGSTYPTYIDVDMTTWITASGSATSAAESDWILATSGSAGIGLNVLALDSAGRGIVAAVPQPYSGPANGTRRFIFNNLPPTSLEIWGFRFAASGSLVPVYEYTYTYFDTSTTGPPPVRPWVNYGVGQTADNVMPAFNGASSTDQLWTQYSSPQAGPDGIITEIDVTVNAYVSATGNPYNGQRLLDETMYLTYNPYEIDGFTLVPSDRVSMFNEGYSPLNITTWQWDYYALTAQGPTLAQVTAYYRTGLLAHGLSYVQNSAGSLNNIPWVGYARDIGIVVNWQGWPTRVSITNARISNVCRMDEL